MRQWAGYQPLHACCPLIKCEPPAMLPATLQKSSHITAQNGRPAGHRLQTRREPGLLSLSLHWEDKVRQVGSCDSPVPSAASEGRCWDSSCLHAATDLVVLSFVPQFPICTIMVAEDDNISGCQPAPSDSLEVTSAFKQLDGTNRASFHPWGPKSGHPGHPTPGGTIQCTSRCHPWCPLSAGNLRDRLE